MLFCITKKLSLFSPLLVIAFLFLLFPKEVTAVSSSGEWVQVGSMNTNRSGHGIMLLDNGEVLVTGGYNGAYLKSSEIYNPTTKNWRTTGDLNDQRILFLPPNLVKLDDGRVLVSTGETNGVNGLFSTEIYNPDTEVWSKVANTNIKRYRAVLAPLPGNKVLLASGSQNNGNRFIKSAEIYDPGTNTWSFTESMNKGRDSEERFVVLGDGRVMIAGGESGVGVIENTAEIYDPITESWTISTMPYPMLGGALVLLDNGKVLLTGGKNGAQAVNLTALYDPATNSWASVSPMNVARELHSAILLDDGKVLVFGGRNQSNAALSSSEIYDPISNTWSSGPAFPVASMLNSSIKLSNGDYLITGGFNGISQQLYDAYLFTDGNPDLQVPLLKQTDSPWADDLYDSANLWTSDPSFYRWGCAVTSAAMVFNYYGLNQMEDGSSLDPGSLNEWLKSQSDGYIGNGNTNWLALSRLSKRISDFNGVSFNALEFSRTVASDHDIVKNEIDNEIPSILKVPEHFVVAKGYTDDNILINDPYYERDDLTAYENTFQNISTFTPSNTDLSYLMLIVNDDVSIKVFDGDNNEVGDLIIEEPIADPAGEITSNTEPLKIVYVAKPSSGKYRIEISADGKTNYILDAYLYDEEGNVKQFSFDDSIHKETDTYHIDFDKNDNSDSYVLENATYTTLIKEIKNLYDNKELKLGAYIEISTKLKLAQTAQKNNTLEKRYLNDLKNTVRKLYRNKEISSFANEYLTKRIEFLIDNI